MRMLSGCKINNDPGKLCRESGGGGWKSSSGDNLFIPDCKALIWLGKGCQRGEGKKLHIEVAGRREWDMGSSVSRPASNNSPVNILDCLCFKVSHSEVIAFF